MFKLSLYLKRARDSDLSISLFADSDGFKGTLGLLEASTRQWRNLNINAYPKSVKALAGNPFPLLRSLQVHSDNYAMMVTILWILPKDHRVKKHMAPGH